MLVDLALTGWLVGFESVGAPFQRDGIDAWGVVEPRVGKNLLERSATVSMKGEHENSDGGALVCSGCRFL